jgi:hypothetical protein
LRQKAGEKALDPAVIAAAREVRQQHEIELHRSRARCTAARLAARCIAKAAGPSKPASAKNDMLRRERRAYRLRLEAAKTPAVHSFPARKRIRRRRSWSGQAARWRRSSQEEQARPHDAHCGGIPCVGGRSGNRMGAELAFVGCYYVQKARTGRGARSQELDEGSFGSRRQRRHRGLPTADASRGTRSAQTRDRCIKPRRTIKQYCVLQ